MSFGFGASDCISLGIMAWNLYKSCKDSAAEFQRISGDLSNLHVVLKEVAEAVEHDSTGLSPTRADRFKEVIGNTTKVLEELGAELTKYGSLDTKTQKKWDMLRWGLKNVSDIKMRIIASTTTLNAFLSAMTHSSHTRLEKVIMKFLKEVNQGYHEGSVLTTTTVDSINTKEAWLELRHELEELGINASVLNEKRGFIVELLQRAKADGTIDEADIPNIEGFEFDIDNSKDNAQNTTDNEPDDDFSSEISRTTTLVGSAYEQRLTRLSSDPLPQRSTAAAALAAKRARPTPRTRRLKSLIPKIFRAPDIRILEAADAGDLEQILDLIAARVNIQTTDRWDWTALHMAAYGGYEEMTRVLIEEGADLDARTVDDERPGDLAEIKGHVEVVRVIEEELERRAKRAAGLVGEQDEL